MHRGDRGDRDDYRDPTADRLDMYTSKYLSFHL